MFLRFIVLSLFVIFNSSFFFLHSQNIVDEKLESGRLCLQRGEWELARKHYTDALESEPANLTALFFRAYADEQMGKYNFARRDYESILAIVPEHFETRLCLVLLNQRSDHLTEAYDHANMLIAQHPDSAVAYFARAGVERDLKMIELAERDYSEAIRRNSTSTDYLFARMETLLLLERYDQARADLEELTRLGVPRQQLKRFFRMCDKRKRKER